MLIGTMHSLNLTRDRFYKDYRFADLFAQLKRAPDSVMLRIREIPGISHVETRVVADVKLDIQGFSEPVTAKLVSVPDSGSPLLNRLHIRKGRSIDPAKNNEVIVSEAFAEAHRFSPGDSFAAVINGRLEKAGDRRDRSLSGVRAPDEARSHKPGLQTLCHPLDGQDSSRDCI